MVVISLNITVLHAIQFCKYKLYKSAIDLNANDDLKTDNHLTVTFEFV